MSKKKIKEEFLAKFTEGKQDVEMNKEPVQCKDVEMKIEEEIEIKEELIENDVKDVSCSSMQDEGATDSSDSESQEEELIELEEEEEIEYPYVSSIRNALGIVGIPGTFACGGLMKRVKLQLSVKGLGKIKLPLSYKQGEILKTKCTVAPYGQGSKTLVDKSVRDAWQVDANDVTLDKKFDSLIKEKVLEIIPTLMGESHLENQEVIPELYKLVYYEKGGHFLAHRDTEKAPGMFATLVITLPAYHMGGALVVKHKGETKIFDFEEYSRYFERDCSEDSNSNDTDDDAGNSSDTDDDADNFFFTAFFADCEHELREITSGHRLVLIYNLVRKNTNSIQLDNDNIQPINNEHFMTTMKHSVEEWKSDLKGPQYLALKLDHLYTDANTSFKHLKGKDKNIADALSSCADIELYIATLIKNEKRFGHNDDPDEWGDKPELMNEDEAKAECCYILQDWIGLNDNNSAFGKLELNKNEMLLKEVYMFQKYEKRCGSEYEYMGNSGCEINYFYKKKALVFWPKSHKILISCNTNFSSVLVNCKKLSGRKLDDKLEMLNGILQYIEKRHDKAMNELKKGDKVANIFEIMALFEDKINSQANSFLLSLAKPYLSNESFAIFCSWDKPKKVGLPNKKSAVALAILINKLGWESLKDSVLQLVRVSSGSHIMSCSQLVRSLLSLGLQEPVISVVEVATPKIIAVDYILDDRAIWAVLLASHDMFSSFFDDFIKEISKMRGYVLSDIIIQIYKSLNHTEIKDDKIKLYFQTFLGILQNNGWKDLSQKDATQLWPVVAFVETFNQNVPLLNSFVKTVIEHKHSSSFLKQLLILPNVVEAKDNPSVQLMVQKRLQQLDVPYPVFSWAMPNADIDETMSFNYYGGPPSNEVNVFLKSNDRAKTFRGVFISKADANQFGREYFLNGKYNKSGKYSARYELSGKGKNVECKVIKTKGCLEEEVRSYNLICEEAKVLKKKFCLSKEI